MTLTSAEPSRCAQFDLLVVDDDLVVGAHRSSERDGPARGEGDQRIPVRAPASGITIPPPASTEQVSPSATTLTSSGPSSRKNRSPPPPQPASAATRTTPVTTLPNPTRVLPVRASCGAVGPTGQPEPGAARPDHRTGASVRLSPDARTRWDACAGGGGRQVGRRGAGVLPAVRWWRRRSAGWCRRVRAGAVGSRGPAGRRRAVPSTGRSRGHLAPGTHRVARSRVVPRARAPRDPQAGSCASGCSAHHARSSRSATSAPSGPRSIRSPSRNW